MYSDVDESGSLIVRAQQHYQERDFLSAALLYERALLIEEAMPEPDPGAVRVLLSRLGLSHRALRQFERAEPLLERSLAMYVEMLPPNDLKLSNAKIELGLLYWAMGDEERAEPLLRSALELREGVLPEGHPRLAGALSNLGFLYYSTGDYARAEPLLTRALAIREKQLEVKAAALGREQPGAVRELTRLGWLYARVGEYARAEPLLLRAHKVNPAVTGIYVRLVSEYERRGQTGDAIGAYESWLRVDPHQPGVKNNLAWLLASAEDSTPWDLDRALELAREARRGMPKSPGVADTLGWVMLKRNRPQVAVPLFRESIAGHPRGSAERAAVRYRLARAYERTGESQRSIQELESALDERAHFPERTAAKRLLARLRSERGTASAVANQPNP